MAITIDGSGTVTGISAGGLPDGVITTDDIAANAVTYAKIGTTEQGQLCKAWVNFDGTGTVAIRASYNVSSITDRGTGAYTVNFTTNMPDANYSVVGLADEFNAIDTTVGNHNTALTGGGGSTASACAVYAVAPLGNNASASLGDCEVISVAIFR